MGARNQAEFIQDPDEEIRACCQRQDAKTATLCALRHHGRELLAFLYGVLGDDAAEDANQELWAAIFSSILSFQGQSRFRTWAYVIAWRICGAFLRDRDRRRLLEPLSAVPELLSDEAQLRVRCLTGMRATLESAVGRIRQRLAPEERMLLILRVDQELSWREIASILLPDGSQIEQEEQRLRQRFVRIKNKIRQEACKIGLMDGRKSA